MYKRIDYLPHIPEHMIPDVSTFVDDPTVSFGNVFRVYDVGQDVLDLLHPYIDFEASIRWQVVSDDLPVHYDTGRSSVKYWDVIEKGGSNVTTTFWSQKGDDPYDGGTVDQDDRSVILRIDEDIKQWHVIDVKTPHNVTGIETVRYALIIRPV